MSTSRDQFVIDESDNKTAVLLRIDRYSELLEVQEELEAIQAYDEAKASKDEAIHSQRQFLPRAESARC